jgi:hypothetical protein
MARSRLKLGLLALAALTMAGPAAAQFGSIFNEPPPRPPADVPSAPPPDYRPPPYYPTRRDVPPPGADEPPAKPLPAPMSLPPSSRPGGGTIQSQPLAPPPGAQQAPPPAENASRGPIETLPGLAPGQRQPRGAPQDEQPQQPAATEPPKEEVVVAPPPQRITNPTAVFSGLDKITGRITSFDVAINETVQFGALQVTPRVCYSRPPTETPQTDAFVEVDEVTLQGAIKRIFTGWMFAASPGLHAVEHPIYDVWLTDCKGGKNPAVAEVPEDEQQTAKPAPKPAAKPAPRLRRTPRRAQEFRGFTPR